MSKADIRIRAPGAVACDIEPPASPRPIPRRIGLRSIDAGTAFEPASAVRWTIAVGVTIAVLMDALNGTIFTIARPQIMGDALATPDEASWVNTGYLIAKLTCLPSAAWIVDRIGEARAFLWSALTVVVASILCTLPIPLETFVGARIIQGAAGAALLVSAQTILFRLFPSAKQGLTQAVYALGVVMAPTTLVPAVQGWLTDDFSWTWVFWLNAALAPLAFLCLTPFWSRLPNTVRMRRPFDWIGFVLFSLAMTAIVYVLLQGPRWNWFEAAQITASTLVGAASLVAVVGWRIIGQKRSELFDRSTFTDAHFGFGFFVSFVAGFALFGSAFLIPTYALNVLRMSAMDAGLLLLPSSLAVGTGLLIAGGLINTKNLNPLKLVPLGIGLVMTAMWMLSWSNLDSGTHDLWAGLLIRGLGLGFLFLPVTLITLSGLQEEQVATGVGLFNFGRQMGGIIGISFLSTYLDHQIELNRRVLIKNIDPASIPFLERQEAIAETLTSRGFDPGLADEGAAAVIQSTLQGQVAALSFNEAFFALVMLFVVAVPLILAFKLMQKISGWSH
ncbi:MAG: DHA2 family efflux MFS transporter permease subunit [Rhizobiaceae bacterium]|nr:DHA2 family efflux MFS transporter permease subunit [Rhizobiaceae bacterium]